MALESWTICRKKEFTDDCIFNESMEEHHYNTYSSTYNSNARHTLYLALNRHGEPRKLQIPPSRSLGKLATYTKSLTESVSDDRAQKLIGKLFGPNRVKHGVHHLCDAGKPLVNLTIPILKGPPKCKEKEDRTVSTATTLSSHVSTSTEHNKKRRIGAYKENNSRRSNSSSSSNINGNFTNTIVNSSFSRSMTNIKKTDNINRNENKKHCGGNGNAPKKKKRKHNEQQGINRCNKGPQNSTKKHNSGQNKKIKHQHQSTTTTTAATLIANSTTTESNNNPNKKT